MNRIICVLAGAALATTAAGAAGPDDAALRSYALSMPKIQAYSAAGKALSASTDPAVKREAQSLDGLLDGSLAQAYAKLRAAPHIEAIIHKSGLSDADFVLLPTVLMTAGMATEVPPAQRAGLPVSAANIAFVQQHQAEIKASHVMNSGN